MAEVTDWDQYYRNTPGYTSITRAISSRKIIGLLRKHAPRLPMTICEVGGANSCFVEAVCAELQVSRYHPDNQETGDELRFSEIVEAHNTLRDPVKRAQYDLQHKSHSDGRRELAEEASKPQVIERDVVIQDKLLSLLYVKRRNEVNNAGIGDSELERLSGCPREHLEFHLWYLKAKGWIGKTENGTYAITVEGVDRATSEHRRETPTRLLTHPDHTG